MTAPTRARALGIAAIAVLCLACQVTGIAQAAEEPGIHYEDESLAAYQQQLAKGEIATVTVNKRLRSLRITLKNGKHVKARYEPHQSKAEIAKLEAKKIPTNVLKPSEAEAEAKSVPRHHKLRYIAAAVIVALVVIVGGLLLLRRKRSREDEDE